MRRNVLIVMCVLAGLAMAGCGSSEQSGDSEEFVRASNAACVESNEKTGAKIRRAFETPRYKTAATHREAISFEVNVTVPILVEDAESQLRAIRAQDAPSEDEAEIEAIVAAYEQWLEKADATPLQVVIASDIFNDARELASKYGLAKCGDSPYEERYVIS